MTNGHHQHTCAICGCSFWCCIVVVCFYEASYNVCDKPACIEAWDTNYGEAGDVK